MSAALRAARLARMSAVLRAATPPGMSAGLGGARLAGMSAVLGGAPPAGICRVEDGYARRDLPHTVMRSRHQHVALIDGYGRSHTLGCHHWGRDYAGCARK